MAMRVVPFWKRKSLTEMDQQEWESLCDGCGLCCLQKLEDEDEPQAFYYTRIACKLLDHQSCQCSDYPNRQAKVPDCIQLTPGAASDFAWLPPTCGYRLVADGADLPAWHHLVCGDRKAVHKVGISLSGQMLAEGSVDDDDWEDHIICRVG